MVGVVVGTNARDIIEGVVSKKKSVRTPRCIHTGQVGLKLEAVIHGVSGTAKGELIDSVRVPFFMG